MVRHRRVLVAPPRDLDRTGQPLQHDALAASTFAAAFTAGVFVGQLRTQLGLPGKEYDGPAAAAQALLDLIAAKGASRS